jgi:exoribonuclease R
VRSVAKLDYTGLQRQIDSGSPPEAVALLPEVGTLRQQLARARHSINIDLPEQDVVESPAGYTITLRAPLPVEQWNAEISLLTGMCAAKIMLDAGHGILRTVPPPDERAVDALKAAARALGIDYPDGALPGDVLASVNPNDPRHVAFVEHAGALLRGSAYTVFDGTAPQQPLHAGIGAAYAHVTAPLRRLVDRFATEICLAAQANSQTPRWVRDRLAQLPGLMAAADRRAHEADRAVIDMTEAWLLQERIGQRFRATVIDANTHSATIVLDEPAVRARCAGENLTVGATIPVTLVGADVAKRTVSFTA